MIIVIEEGATRGVIVTMLGKNDIDDAKRSKVQMNLADGSSQAKIWPRHV